MKKPKKELLLLTLFPLIALGIGKQGIVAEAIVKRIVGMDVEAYVRQKKQQNHAVSDMKKMKETIISFPTKQQSLHHTHKL